MNYRNPKLLRLSRGKPCMARIPGVCNANPETTVAAHSNSLRHGKGKGIKAHDCFAAWMCSACHTEVDQSPRLSREERQEIWQLAFERTIQAAFQSGAVTIA